MTLPITPKLAVRPATAGDGEALSSLLNISLAGSIFSRIMTGAEVAEQLFTDAPPTILPVRWRKHVVFVALRVGEMVGLLDAAVGLDSESQETPDYQPHGLLRFWVLPEDRALIDECANALLAAAEEFWRRSGVGLVKAYHPSTGYPQWQGGLGLLPADWTEQIRLLTSSGFRYIDRYYCFVRAMRGELFEESAPQTGLTLVFRGANQDRRYQIFFRRTELIGEARVVQRTVETEGRTLHIAHIVHWEVDLRWRNQHLGRWMLRRMINDAAQQSLDQMIVFVRMQQAAAINLLVQHGFVEHPYRGYVMEKALRT
jgi:ribosomal protein S18 acetylase RimI-like enzyme